MSAPLKEFASVVLGAGGNGEVQLRPLTSRTVWEVTNLAVSTTTNALEPTAKVFLGPATATGMLAGTYTGSNDSTELAVRLLPGQYLTVRWEGGDVGARATASVYGSQGVL